MTKYIKYKDWNYLWHSDINRNLGNQSTFFFNVCVGFSMCIVLVFFIKNFYFVNSMQPAPLWVSLLPAPLGLPRILRVSLTTAQTEPPYSVEHSWNEKRQLMVPQSMVKTFFSGEVLVWGFNFFFFSLVAHGRASTLSLHVVVYVCVYFFNSLTHFVFILFWLPMQSSVFSLSS